MAKKTTNLILILNITNLRNNNYGPFFAHMLHEWLEKNNGT